MLSILLAACSGDVYILQGVVVEVHPPAEVLLDHEAIPGVMDAMVMEFEVADPAMLEGVAPGDRITARYQRDDGKLVKWRVTGHGPPPAVPPAPLRVGDALPAVEITTAGGETVLLGPAQTERVALAFVYTTCPRPEFCPALVTRLQGLAQALGDAPGVRILAVTIDPERDTLPVLAEYAAKVGPGITFGRAAELDALATRSGLSVMRGTGDIEHSLRTLVLDRGGVLLERYDDARFPLDRVAEQLRTGVPRGDPAQSGTKTPVE